MSYEVKGIVKEVDDIVEFDGGFKKRTVVLSVQDGNYTNDFAVDFLKEKADASSSLKIGDEVEVNFNVRCKKQESTGRWFTNAQGWKWNVTASSEITY